MCLGRLPISFVYWMVLLNNMTCLCSDYFHTAAISDSVVLQCCCGTGLNNKWKYRDVFIYFNRVEVDGRFGNSTTLSKNYSLVINHVSIYHDGIYECMQDSTVLSRHILVVEVPPKLFTVVNGIEDVSEIILEANQEVHLICHALEAKPVANLSWVVNDRIVNSLDAGYSVSTESGNRHTFDSSSEYAGQLPNDEGNISCVSSGQSVHSVKRVDMKYFRYALPTIFLTVNGQNYSDEVHLPKHSEILITCNVFGSSPVPKVDVLINNVPFDAKNLSVSPTKNNPTVFKTFDSSLTLNYNTTDQNGTIICVAKLEKVNITRTAEIAFYTHAIPMIHMSINGQPVHHVVFVEPHHQIEVYCVAHGSGPGFTVRWLVNNMTVSGLGENVRTETWSEDEGERHRVHSILWFYPEMKNGNITCISSGRHIGETRVKAYYQIKEINRNAEVADQKNIYPFLSIPVLAIVVLPFAGYYLTRKAVAARSSSTNPVYIQRYDKRQSSIQLRGESTFESQRTNNELINPPRLKLPEIPDPAKSQEPYSNVTTNQSTSINSYSALTERNTQGRMFNESDMCLVFNVKMGAIYNRWVGSINESNKRNKNVFISTASEAVLLTKDIRWEAFVRRVMELPENKNLVKVEGISVDATHIYLLHEHLMCQTLDNSLHSSDSGNKHGLGNFMTATDVMKHTLGILEGMEIIHSYGFLHPGLSTKKIVVTKQGTCKLYDFCLKDDASHVLTIKKSKDPMSANMIAPESMLRNEYFPASDVWSAAVVIWEILSGGLPPFPYTDSMYKGQIFEKELPHVWPQRYLQFRNDRMFDCWQQDVSLRPTIHELKLSFKGICESVEENLSKISSTSTSDLYMPMKELCPDNGSCQDLERI